MRALIVLTLVVMIVGFYFAVVVPYQRQMNAIEQVEAMEGTVFTEPVGPDWFREWVGDERMKGFDRVYGLTKIEPQALSGTGTADDGLPTLAVFSQLKTLDLSNSQITDAGLSHLRGLAELESVSFDLNPITDNGLKEIGQWMRLKRLFLNRTQITDAGLMHLHGLSNLEVISLNGTQVTREGVAELQRLLPKCEVQSDE